MEALIMTLAGTGVVALILNIWLSTKSGKNGLKIYKEKRGNRLRLIPRFCLVLNGIGFCQYRFSFKILFLQPFVQPAEEGTLP